MAEETVVIRFKGEDDVSKVAENVTSSVEGVGKSVGSAGSKFSGLSSIATGAFEAIGGAAIKLAGGALSAVSDFFISSISEASDWNAVITQTEAVVASTGAAAGYTAEQLGKMASELSAGSGASLFSDDAILGAENILATFTQIRGENFGGATQAILDMSQALGMDLKSASMQVGKALNDPIAGMSALSRSGVAFTDEQKELIKSMTETGDVAGAQKLILNELAIEFGGSAAMATQTFAGQQIILAEQLNNVKQTLGESLLPVISQFVGYAQDYLIPIITDVVDQFVSFIETVDWPALINAFSSLESGAASMGEIIEDVFNGIMVQVMLFWNIVKPIWEQFTAVLLQAGAELAPLGALFNETFGGIEDASSSMAPIGEFLGNIAKAIINVAGIFIQILVPVIKFIFPLILQYVADVITGFMNLYNAINYVFSGKLQSDIATWWSTTISLIITSVNKIITAATTLGSQIVGGIIAGVESMKQKLYDTFGGLVSGAVSWLKKLLGIASPSKVMAETIGRPIAQGLAAGIMSGIPDIRGSSAVAGAATTQTIQNYYLSASYQTAQSESTIASDIRAMQLLSGGV